MITATIGSVTKNQTSVSVLVTFYKDGVFFANANFDNVDPSTFKTQVINKINQFQAIEEIDISWLKGDIDLTPDLVITPVLLPPTPNQISQNTFLNDLAQLKQMNTAIALGLKTTQDKDYADLLTKLRSEFISDYLNLL